jgi:hypothetical protein
MRLTFWDRRKQLHSVIVEPQHDAPLPKIAFVGVTSFLLDDIVSLTTGGVEAHYQKHDALVLPAPSSIIMPPKEIIQ